MDILTSGDERYVVFPIQHPDIWEMYKKHVASFWTAEEIDLDRDKADWEALTENEKHFIKHILAFFSSADGIVNENLVLRFYSDVHAPEARCFYTFQMAMESIHSETYSLLIDTLVSDKNEQTRLFNATTTIPCIKDKADWCKKWIQSCDSFPTRLVAFSAVEGLLFSSAFASIFWLKKRGILPGLTFSNELISRDEGLHTEFACLLYHKIGTPLPTETVHQIIDEAVKLEENFITSALPCSLLGLNCHMMTEYIKFVADRLLESLGEKKLYFCRNPFDWMELISLQGKTNFFERRVGEYQKKGVMSSLTEEKDEFSIIADF